MHISEDSETSLVDSIESNSSKMSGKQTNWPYVFNLGNSIIGVSVLAMPYCFKECGVVLGMLLLLSSAWLTYTSCNLLIKGAVSTRRRSYEYLAFDTFGPLGKLCVEISIIGLLIGTCVAFFVIIGDLGPGIISKLVGIENTPNLRMFLMIFLAAFVALPLGLLRNIESLSNISAVSLGFYSVFIAEVIALAFPNLWSGIWVTEVVYWNPEGVFKCLPIFSISFSCQSQLFVMYDALSDPSAKRMKTITKSAIGMCTAVYMMVGYFGYVAFCDNNIAGDILKNFHSTIFSEAVKLGFVMSVAASFPLAIFPCRASIYTLLFAKEKSKSHHDNITGGRVFIPDVHFKLITIFVVFGTLTIGILVPNIEFVLAITGATMGSLICYIFPAIMFISITSVNKTNNKSMAQLVLFLGVTILLASTYVTLNGQQDETAINTDPQVFRPPKFIDRHPQSPPAEKGEDIIKALEDRIDKDPPPDDKKEKEDSNDQRQEPPNPHAPADDEDEKDHDKGKEEKAEESVKEKEIEMDKKEGKKKSEIDVKPEDDKEVKVAAKEEESKKKDDEDVKELLVEMKKQQEKQEVILAQQQELIEQLKQHNEEHKAEAKESQQAGQQAQAGGQQPVAGGQQQPVVGDQQPQQQQPLAGGQQQQQQQPIAGGQQQQQQPVVGGQPQLLPVAGGQQQQQHVAGGQPQLLPVAGGQQQQQQPIAGGQQQQIQPVAVGQPQQLQPIAGGQQQQQQPVAGGQPQQQPLAGDQQQQQQQQPIAGGQQRQQQPVVGGQPQLQPVAVDQQQQQQQQPAAVGQQQQQPVAVGQQQQQQQPVAVGQPQQQPVADGQQQQPVGGQQLPVVIDRQPLQVGDQVGQGAPIQIQQRVNDQQVQGNQQPDQAAGAAVAGAEAGVQQAAELDNASKEKKLQNAQDLIDNINDVDDIINKQAAVDSQQQHRHDNNNDNNIKHKSKEGKEDFR